MTPDKKRGKKYKCNGNHKSFDHPTTKAKPWCYSTKIINEEDILTSPEGTNDQITSTKTSTSTSTSAANCGNSSKKGVLAYLEEICKEKEKVLKDAVKIKAKYQYLLDDKKQLSNRMQYLEEKLAESNKKATALIEKSDLSENIRQAISNVVSTHYSQYGENLLVEKSQMLFGHITL